MVDTAMLARQLEQLYPRDTSITVAYWPTPSILNEPLTASARMRTSSRRPQVLPRRDDAVTRVARTAATGSGRLSAVVWSKLQQPTLCGMATCRAPVRGEMFCKIHRARWKARLCLVVDCHHRAAPKCYGYCARHDADPVAPCVAPSALSPLTGTGTLLSAAAVVPSFHGRGVLAAGVEVVDLRNVYWDRIGERWCVEVRKCYGGRYQTADEAVVAARALRSYLGVPEKARRRPRNSGGLCWIPPSHRHKGRWRASVTVYDNGKQRQVTRYAYTRELASSVLAELLAEHCHSSNSFDSVSEVGATAATGTLTATVYRPSRRNVHYDARWGWYTQVRCGSSRAFRGYFKTAEEADAVARELRTQLRGHPEAYGRAPSGTGCIYFQHGRWIACISVPNPGGPDGRRRIRRVSLTREAAEVKLAELQAENHRPVTEKHYAWR